MADPTQMLRQGGPSSVSPLVTGYVVNTPSKPAPTSFSSPVYVMDPQYSSDFVIGPCRWGAIHGGSLPQAGAECLIATDNRGVPEVVWWDGAYTPTGPQVPQGLDPTGLTDMTALLNAAVTHSLFIPQGTYLISGVLTINLANDFRGAGTNATIFKLGPAGQIRHGARTVAPTPQGGYTGDFTVDGNSVANVAGGGFYVGTVVSRQFANLWVRHCLTDNIVCEAAQNCNWHNLNSQDCGGASMVWDYGMGGCVFTGHTELYGGGTYNLDIRQSGASPAYAFPTILGPSYNMITGGFIEGSLGGPAANVQNTALIHHGAGTGNVINLPNGLAGNPSAAPYSLVIVEKQNLAGTNAVSQDLTFIDLNFQDNNGFATGLDMRGSSSVILRGKTNFSNVPVGIETYDTDFILVQGLLNWATTPVRWKKNPAAGATTMQQVIRTIQNVRTDMVLSAPSDAAVLSYVQTLASTTIAAGSNAVNLNTSPGTINVASTAGFSPAGVIYVNISGVLQQMNYTGMTSTTFTGCTNGFVCAGVLATGQAVTQSDPGPRARVDGLGVWVSDGTFDPQGLVGMEYYTPDSGATKYVYMPASMLLGGNFQMFGSKSAVNGNAAVAKAAAIASPTSDTVGGKAAIDAIRVALQNFGITL